MRERQRHVGTLPHDVLAERDRTAQIAAPVPCDGVIDRAIDGDQPFRIVGVGEARLRGGRAGQVPEAPEPLARFGALRRARRPAVGGAQRRQQELQLANLSRPRRRHVVRLGAVKLLEDARFGARW